MFNFFIFTHMIAVLEEGIRATSKQEAVLAHGQH